MPKRYQLILATVEAMKLEPSNVERVAVWCGGVEVTKTNTLDSTKKFVALNIPTLQGAQRASEGDYVVKDRNGGFFVILAREFEAQYQLI